MKLIYLEWADAISNNNWFPGDSARIWADKQEWIIRETGWVIKETKEYICLASTWKPEDEYTDEKFMNLHKIPKTWIRKRKTLKVK